jgi:peptide/nickel transport system permease protein
MRERTASLSPPRPGVLGGLGGSLPRLLRNRQIVVGGAIVLAVVLTALLADVLAPHDPYAMNMAQRLRPPFWQERAIPGYPLGTDNFGRDLLSRIVYGARVSLMVGIVAVGIALAVGVALGALAGYFGGAVDLAVSRLVDVFLAFPFVLLALSFVAALGPSLPNVVIALGLIYWTTYARVVRASVLALREEDYVLAARALGAGGGRTILSHILPNAVAPVLVIATLGLGGAITAEAALSFLGLGVQPPEASWGSTLTFGLQFLRQAPHMSTFPGLAIMLTVLGFNLLGDGLRDVLDPRLGNRL